MPTLILRHAGWRHLHGIHARWTLLQDAGQSWWSTRSLTTSCFSLQQQASTDAQTSPREQDADLAHLCNFMKHAARYNNRARVEELFKEYITRGGEPRLWQFNMFINMYARAHMPQQAFSVLNGIRDAELQPDEFTFANLMNACAKAEHPPYPLADKFADKALELLAQMKAFGLKPNDVHYNTVMSCQAKAKRLSMVEKLMEEMHDAGIKPHSRSFNILIGAAARTGNVVRALQVAEEDLPAAGLKQDTVTYNTAKDKDGALYVWQRMKEKLIMTDVLTERALASAFDGNPQLAEKLVRECREHGERVREIQQKQRNGDDNINSDHETTNEEETPRPARFVSDRVSQYRQDNEINLGERGTLHSLFRLDLHGLSRAAATLALHARLSQLATIYCVGANNLLKEIWKKDSNDNGRIRSLAKKYGLVVIVGKGLHSFKNSTTTIKPENDEDDKGVLGDLVEDLLLERNLKVRRIADNLGRMVVNGHDLAAWLEQQKQSQQQDFMRGSAGIRMFLMGACSASAAAFFIVMPVLLRYSSLS